MEGGREIPDAIIMETALEFLQTAKLLLANVPRITAPVALRVNAAFSIELLLKSLNSTWIFHPIEIDPEEDVEERAYRITAKPMRPDKSGHDLFDLYRHLEESHRRSIEEAFSQHGLGRQGGSVGDLLKRYATTFASERYWFENPSSNIEQHPIGEIVALAEFVASYVTALPRVRY